MNRHNVEVRGTVRIVTQVGFKRPGQPENCTWHKTVQLHVEHSVTLEQAAEILDKWKQVNQDCMASFSCPLY
jgi:hypothetical protein